MGLVPTLLASAALASPAIAQSETGSSEADLSEPEIGDIVVTARKRQETLSTVPESISAVTAETLQAAGVANLGDLPALVTGFSQIRSQDPGNNFIVIRGITQVRNGEPSVAFVVDGVQASSPDQASQELFDLERVEVLKGPQGPSYGRNALGGAVVITTAAPRDYFEASALAEYGEGDYFKVQGTLSGPLAGEDLLVRVSARHQDDPGQIYDAVAGKYVDALKETAARVRLIARPADGWELDLRASHSDAEGASGGYYPIYPGQDAEARNPVIASRIGDGGRKLTDISAKVDAEFGDVVVTSISSYARAKASTIGQDIDFLPFPVSDAFPGLVLDSHRDVESFSEELRVASSGSANPQWMVGAYYLKTNRDTDATVFLDLGTARGPVLSFLPEVNRNDAYALFANLAWKIGSDVSVELGLRQDWDDRDQLNPATDSQVIESFSKLQPKLSVSYFAGNDTMVYASLGRGFRSGGFNVESPLFSRQYDAETADTAELGLKTKLLDRRLSLNGALFYTRGRNSQTFLFDGNTGAQGILTINKTEFWGGDVELRAAPVHGLDLWAGVSLLDSRIEDYDGTDLYVGNQIPLVNHESVNAGFSFDLPVSRDVELNFRADYAGFGDLAWHVDNLPSERREWVDLVNLRASLQFNNYSLSVFANNLFDEEYAVEYGAARFSGTPTNIAVPNPRRRIGVNVTARF